MGCHTWFSVPYKTDKKEIISLAQKLIDNSKYLSSGHKKMYQWAIDNEIKEVVCELAAGESDCNREGDWILYKDVKNYSVEKYNEEHGTNIDKYDSKACDAANIENYSDEPRIGGYPSNVIKSYKEMVKFIKSGYTDEEGKHFEFRCDADRMTQVMQGIQTFFINHPDGIITFG